MPEDALFSQVQCPGGIFEVKKNESGELSFIQFDCVAKSITEARHAFIRAALPFLDHLVYVANCPLFVVSLRIEDQKNHRTTLDYISPYRKATLNPHIGELFIELGPVYAMYREAKNSSSDFYRFLCYYKILEGLLGSIRANAFKQAKQAGIEPQKPKDVVPNSSDLPASFRAYVGKSVKEFFDAVLTPEFRNAVAHFVTDEGGILNMSDPVHIDKYSKILLVCELCVRVVISSHESLLQSLHR